MEKYIGAARLRLRELDVHYRMSRRELRRARKTAKTYETMMALGKLPGGDVGDWSGLMGCLRTVSDMSRWLPPC